MDRGRAWRHARKRWGYGGLEKKKLVEIRGLGLGLGRKSIFGARQGQTSSLQRGPHVVGFWWESQHRKKLSLSLLMSKNLKLKKVINSFVPEPISCISDSLCLFRVFVSWSYFLIYVTTVHIQYTGEYNTGGNRRMQIQADSFCFRYEPFISFWVQFFDTRRETIIKSLS